MNIVKQLYDTGIKMARVLKPKQAGNLEEDAALSSGARYQIGLVKFNMFGEEGLIDFGEKETYGR